jgi:hypothetical protein
MHPNRKSQRLRLRVTLALVSLPSVKGKTAKANTRHIPALTIDGRVILTGRNDERGRPSTSHSVPALSLKAQGTKRWDVLDPWRQRSAVLIFYFKLGALDADGWGPGFLLLVYAVA